MDNVVQDEIARLNPTSVFGGLEKAVYFDVAAWALENVDVCRHLKHEQIIAMYWDEKLDPI